MALLPLIQVIAGILLVISRNVISYYVSADYYMDPTQSDAFGGVCDDVIRDDSMFISSHMNPFNLVNYGNNKNCLFVIDAGPAPEARYRLRVVKWQVELPDADGTCNDYLAVYDGNAQHSSGNATLSGVYCDSSTPNVTNTATQRYVTFRWMTNESYKDKGFRILAIRTESPPCDDYQFLCMIEDRCISAAVRCDGIDHCDDGSDEIACSAIQRFVRVFLRLGLGGIVAVGVTVFSTVCMFFVVTCCVKCTKANRIADDVSVRPNRFSVTNGTCRNDHVDNSKSRSERKH